MGGSANRDHGSEVDMGTWIMDGSENKGIIDHGWIWEQRDHGWIWEQVDYGSEMDLGSSGS